MFLNLKLGTNKPGMQGQSFLNSTEAIQKYPGLQHIVHYNPIPFAAEAGLRNIFHGIGPDEQCALKQSQFPDSRLTHLCVGGESTRILCARKYTA